MATLTKATTQLSSDAKAKMMAVAQSSITSAKVTGAPVSPDQATRMWAVVAAASGVAAGSASAAAAAGAGTAAAAARHLLSAPTGNTTTTSAYWAGSANSRYNLFSRHLLQTAAFAAPPFLSTAADIAALLAASATPGSGFLSGGEGGMYVSVANQLGRAYASSPVAVGPVLAAAGGAADPLSGSNAVVSFSKALSGGCVAEDGSVDAGTACR